MQMKRGGVLTALALAGLTAACSSSTEPSASAAGTYRLTMVGGDSVPLGYLANGYVVSGSLELRTGGGFVRTERDSMYEPWDGSSYSWRAASFTAIGTWMADGSLLTLTDTTGGAANGNTINATIAPHTILVTWDAGFSEYRYER